MSDTPTADAPAESFSGRMQNFDWSTRIRPGNWSIGAKMIAITAVAAVAMLVVGLVSNSRLESQIYDEREAKTKAIVESGLSLLQHYADLEADGTLTREEAQDQARQAVSAIRYGEGDYFWIHDRDFIMQMHPIKPELDTTDVSGIEDPDGVQLFVEMNQVVADEGAGFVPYMWPKPGFEEPQPKLSYVAELPEWGWIIGSGAYIDNIDAAVEVKREEIGAQIAELVRDSVILSVFLIALSVVISFLFSNGLSRPIMRLTRVAEEISKGKNLDQSIDEVRRPDEIGELAKSISRLKASVKIMMDRMGRKVA